MSEDEIKIVCLVGEKEKGIKESLYYFSHLFLVYSASLFWSLFLLNQ